MKLSYLRAAAALALATLLAACGGKATFDVSGVFVDASSLSTGIEVIVPLPNAGLVLANGSDTVTVPAGATTFTLPLHVSYGDSYNIVVQTPPNHMNCTIANGSGSAGHTVTIHASVVCSQNTYELSGSVSGLTADGLVLLNGNAQVLVAKVADNPNTVFTFGAIPDGQAYGVTVLTQPTGQTCTVTNGTNVMRDTPVSNIQVSCK